MGAIICTSLMDRRGLEKAVNEQCAGPIQHGCLHSVDMLLPFERKWATIGQPGSLHMRKQCAGLTGLKLPAYLTHTTGVRLI